MTGWKLPIYAFLAMGVLGVHAVVMSPVVTAIGAVCAGAAVIGVYRYQGAREVPQLPAANAPEVSPWVATLERLVELNLVIREADLSPAVVAQIEGTIDVLRSLVPQLNTEHTGSELTWTVNRMATDYLPRILEPYAKLSGSERQKNESELVKSLSGLEGELQNIQNLVRQAMEGEFKNRAAFLRARFLEDPSAQA